MSTSFTPARERETARPQAGRPWREDRRSQRAWRFGAGEALLCAASLVGLLAIVLAFAARVDRLALDEASSPVHVINLSTVTSASELEPAFDALSAAPDERRAYARSLFQFLQTAAKAGDELPNVGSIARAVPPAAGLEGHGPFVSGESLAALKPGLVVRTRDEFSRRVRTNVILFVASFYALALVWHLGVGRGDLRLLGAAQLITSLGFALLVSRGDPVRDTLLFERFTHSVVIGVALMRLASCVNLRRAAFMEFSYVPLVLALCLSAVLILLGTGPGTSAAKVNLFSVQPIEAIRLLLALFLAGYFSRRWELLRQVRAKQIRQYRVPAWLNVPRADYVAPVLGGVGAALVLFFFQKDLGPALFLACVFLAMYAVARGRSFMAVVGLGLLVFGFYVGLRLNVSETLADRVRMWLSPWDNSVRGGAQVAQAIWALATGGLFGTGLGLGDTRYLPAGHTDLVLAALGEELGAAGLLAVGALYALIGWRGFSIARSAATDYGFFLATAVTLFLLLPVLVMAGGVLGVTPLTGVVTPFLSYGGSAMAANFTALGLLAAVGAGGPSPTTEPFRAPLRWLSGLLAVAAAALIVALVNVQVIHADDYAVRGHKTLQADGVRRYQYNQRLLDVARQVPRGSVLDRGGLVLATGDATLAQKATADYVTLGVTPDATCVAPVERCYPLGGMAFHLLGNARSRVNWSASNTSFIERDAENRLRGFDDHATTVQTTDSSGRSTFTVRRDYRALLPLLRHRYAPDHPAARAFLEKPRDARVTIDARLQVRVSNILAAYARRSSSGRAAAVVLDPDSGDLLAVASYPWPAPGVGTRSEAAGAVDALLDRARYGLYPPGSTFKLVTAAAALRQDPAATRELFTCERLPDGRVGTRIHGWARPVRDDITDARPHGTIGMHEGLVQSCNAYFAQLAVHVGPAALRETAERVGISMAPSASPERLRQTLPQAGYGQGDVLATPLEMARVAAVFATGGILRDARWSVANPPVESGRPLLPPEGAELIGQYMRDVVTTGTGRSLRANSGRIAGKTGTAEVSGAPSHSWFVGFAPFGHATNRISFAVIVEQAGYGSSAAAPLAGEIVDAALALGIIK